MFKVSVTAISVDYKQVTIQDTSTPDVIGGQVYYDLPDYPPVTRASGNLEFYCLLYNHTTNTVNGGVVTLTNTPFNKSQWTAILTGAEAVYQVYLYCQYVDGSSLNLATATPLQVYNTILAGSNPAAQTPSFITATTGLAIIPEVLKCANEKLGEYCQKLLNSGCACTGYEDFDAIFNAFAYQVGLQDYVAAEATLIKLQNLCNCSDDCNC
jgi:hypothetical protein